MNTKPDVHLHTPKFKRRVEELSKKFELVVETGTNDGTGSTKVFADAGFEVYSCDANKDMYDYACEYHASNKNVHLTHAATTKLEHLDPMYLQTLAENNATPEREGFLERHIDSFGSNALYFLDSHWTLGFLEFRLLLEHHIRTGDRMTVLLDDATNLKHKPSLHYLHTTYRLPFQILRTGERWAEVHLLKP